MIFLGECVYLLWVTTMFPTEMGNTSRKCDTTRGGGRVAAGLRAELCLPKKQRKHRLGTFIRSLTWGSAGLPLPHHLLLFALKLLLSASFCCPLALAPGGRVSNQTVHCLWAAHIPETFARALLSFPFSRCSKLFLLWKHFLSTTHPS